MPILIVPNQKCQICKLVTYGILKLLDEKHVDYEALYKEYSRPTQKDINDKNNMKLGKLTLTLSRDRLERDIDLCAKEFKRSKKDKTRKLWLQRADTLVKLNNNTPTDKYIKNIFAETAKVIKAETKKIHINQTEPSTKIEIDLEKYNISEDIKKYGIFNCEKVKGGMFINQIFIPENAINFLEKETIKKLPAKQKAKLPPSGELKLNVNLIKICDKFQKYEADKKGYKKDTVDRYLKEVNDLVAYMN